MMLPACALLLSVRDRRANFRIYTFLPSVNPFGRANRQYLELVLTLQCRADSADGIREILRATVQSKFEENNQHKNVIIMMM